MRAGKIFWYQRRETLGVLPLVKRSGRETISDVDDYEATPFSTKLISILLASGTRCREINTVFTASRKSFGKVVLSHLSVAGIRKWRSFMEEATDLVTSYGGSISGEHGDGQSKAEFLYKMFGPELLDAFRAFKSIWDPDWKMNPGKIVDPYRIDENLRLGADYKPWNPPTYFRYPDDRGSFAHAALRCVGVGECRRDNGEGEQDTMCPSHMVTREEMHSTRGRTHLLWEMMHGDVIRDGWRDPHIKEALDLCLACKGCKGDCPVNVDMATYKAEFLAHYWEGRFRPLYAYAFGWIDKWARLASVAPSFVNLFTQLPGLRDLVKLTAGVPRQRQIPAFAAEPFQSWFRKRSARPATGPKVLLWADTFNNYFMPETAQAAVEVLESAGCQVQVVDRHLCCGRPLYDYGFLDMARTYLHRNLETLAPYIEADTPMVVLEPSCCSVFRDEMHGLFPESEQARGLAKNTFTLSEFLEKQVPGYQPPRLTRAALVQGHCHHKAVVRLKEEKAVMEKMGLNYEVLESGCCGMAGSFGYEKDKYKVSVACGERSLLPAVRKAGLSTNRRRRRLQLQRTDRSGDQPSRLAPRGSVEVGVAGKKQATTADVSRTTICRPAQGGTKSVHGAHWIGYRGIDSPGSRRTSLDEAQPAMSTERCHDMNAHKDRSPTTPDATEQSHHRSLVRLNPRPKTMYCSQGRAVLATDLDGWIGGFPRHGLFVGETRVLSRYRYLVEDKAPQTVAVSNVEQHSWLGYYILPPPDLRWKEDTGSGEMEPASEETIELKISRTVGLGVHEDVDFTNFTQHPTRFIFEIELDGIRLDECEPALMHGCVRRSASISASHLDRRLEHRVLGSGPPSLWESLPHVQHTITAP